VVHLVGQFGDAFLTGMAALDRDLADAGAVSSRRSDERGGNAQPSSAPPLTADISQDSGHVRLVPILLQKSFWGGERKFLEPLVHFTRGDVRDHIVSSKIDLGPP